MATDATQRGCGENAFRRAARSHINVDIGVGIGRCDHAGDVAIGNQGHTTSDTAQFSDNRFVAGAVSGPEEQQWLTGFRERFEDDGAYFRQQTSRPHTLAFLLGDSPVGLLAWQTEKFLAWSDQAQGSASEKIAQPLWRDRLVLNTLLQLVTGTAASSTLSYRGLAVEGAPGFPSGGRVNVPVAIAAMRDPAFPAPPRSLVERAYRVERWTEYAHGGHFPGYEARDLLCADLAAFAQGL